MQRFFYTHFLIKLWNFLRGTIQWYILWCFHSKFIIGVAGVIYNDKGEILLLRHRFQQEDSWGLPGGFMKNGESAETALGREVKEETGYEISSQSVVSVRSGFKLRFEVYLTAKISGGEQALDPNEIIEARFFPPDQLPSGLLEYQKKVVAEV